MTRMARKVDRPVAPKEGEVEHLGVAGRVAEVVREEAVAGDAEMPLVRAAIRIRRLQGDGRSSIKGRGRIITDGTREQGRWHAVAFRDDRAACLGKTPIGCHEEDARPKTLYYRSITSYLNHK